MRPRPPLDAEALERLALFYAGRYATTRARLAAYLRRKVKERGWEGAGPPPVERLVERFAELGYVDDRGFASARAASLLRRGYGERRVAEALRGAGIAEDDAAEALGHAEENAVAAAAPAALPELAAQIGGELRARRRVAAGIEEAEPLEPPGIEGRTGCFVGPGFHAP